MRKMTLLGMSLAVVVLALTLPASTSAHRTPWWWGTGYAERQLEVRACTVSGNQDWFNFCHISSGDVSVAYCAGEGKFLNGRFQHFICRVRLTSGYCDEWSMVIRLRLHAITATYFAAGPLQRIPSVDLC